MYRLYWADANSTWIIPISYDCFELYVLFYRHFYIIDTRTLFFFNLSENLPINVYIYLPVIFHIKCSLLMLWTFLSLLKWEFILQKTWDLPMTLSSKVWLMEPCSFWATHVYSVASFLVNPSTPKDIFLLTLY